MRWPWHHRPETRASHTDSPETRASYTDSIVSALIADATGTATKTATATAALESCAALYAAAFSRARIEPAVPALTPAVLALIARDLIRRGESVHLIEVDGGLNLRPVGSWDVRGDHRPETWMIRCDLFGPSGNVTRFVSHSSVVHCRYSIDPARPWLGVGPLQWANSTASLAGRLEAGLASEAGASPAQLLPVPQDGGDGGDNDPLASLKTDIAAAKGRVVMVETTQGNFGQGQTGAPKGDWEQIRLGPDWPEVLRSTRADVFEHVVSACGVPPVLLDKSAEGTSQREGLRRFSHLGLEPLGELVAGELRDKLDMPNLTLDFSPLMASDLAGRGLFLKQLVDSGVGLDGALVLAGLADDG